MSSYTWGMSVVNGELVDCFGVRVITSGRCAHGVFDGDKPFTSSGPRCGVCREAWFAIEDATKPNVTAKCPSCKEALHRTYSPSGGEHYAIEGWAHEAPNGCRRLEFPVRGYEGNFFGYGWGDWENWSKFLSDQFQDALERNSLLEERSGK